MPDTETPNDSRETLSYIYESLERLHMKMDPRLASIETSIGEVMARLDIQLKQLDHLDGMLHEVHQFIEEHKPALGRALGFLDPGRSMRDYLKHRPKAGKDGHG